MSPTSCALCSVLPELDQRVDCGTKSSRACKVCQTTCFSWVLRMKPRMTMVVRRQIGIHPRAFLVVGSFLETGSVTLFGAVPLIDRGLSKLKGRLSSRWSGRTVNTVDLRCNAHSWFRALIDRITARTCQRRRDSCVSFSKCLEFDLPGLLHQSGLCNIL